MGRKRRKNTGHKPASDRLSQAERDAIDWCRGQGLYLLVHGVGKGRQWAVYRRSDGAALGAYWPCQGRYQRGRWAGLNVWEWRDALDRIVRPAIPD